MELIRNIRNILQLIPITTQHLNNRNNHSHAFHLLKEDGSLDRPCSTSSSHTSHRGYGSCFP